MSTENHQSEYSEADIRILSAVECVRNRAGMYVGPPDDPKAINRLLAAALWVPLQDAARGVCTRIDVTLHRDGSATVADDGPGVPMRPLPDGRPRAEELMTGETSHWMIANALAEWCVLTTSHEGNWWTQRYRQGVRSGPFQRESAAAETGLRLSFKPDATILRHTEFDPASLGPWLYGQELDLRSTVVVLTDERHGTVTRLR